MNLIVILVTCIIGVIFKFQTSVYEKQRAKLLEQDEQLYRVADEGRSQQGNEAAETLTEG